MLESTYSDDDSENDEEEPDVSGKINVVNGLFKNLSNDPHNTDMTNTLALLKRGFDGETKWQRVLRKYIAKDIDKNPQDYQGKNMMDVWRDHIHDILDSPEVKGQSLANKAGDAMEQVETKLEKSNIQLLRQYATSLGIDQSIYPQNPEAWQIRYVQKGLKESIMLHLESLPLPKLGKALDVFLDLTDVPPPPPAPTNRANQLTHFSDIRGWVGQAIRGQRDWSDLTQAFLDFDDRNLNNGFYESNSDLIEEDIPKWRQYWQTLRSDHPEQYDKIWANLADDNKQILINLILPPAPPAQPTNTQSPRRNPTRNPNLPYHLRDDYEFTK